MRDIPIIFSASMVLALLREVREPGTGKSMTRRLAWGIPFAASDDATPIGGILWQDQGNGFYRKPSPWRRVKPGDRLWVRENWRADNRFKFTKPRNIPVGSRILYEADYDEECELGGKLRPSIFLPRWASRLTLVVTETKIERLQDISETDARREGAVLLGHAGKPYPIDFMEAEPMRWRLGFEQIWRKLHGDASWKKNPWVVSLGFTVYAMNIDEMKEAA